MVRFVCFLRIRRFFVLLLASALCVNCGKSRDEQPLKDVKEPEIKGINPVYMIEPGETLIIDPEIHFASGVDTGSYRYEWIYLRMVGYFVDDENTKVSTTARLEYNFPGWHLAAYEMAFRVIDTVSGLFTEKEITVIVGNDVYEGWILLCDDGGRTRVDMLSYRLDSAGFVHFPNVLRAKNPGHSPSGSPVQIYSPITFFMGAGYGMAIVVTDEGMFVYDDVDLEYTGNAIGSHLPVARTSELTRLRIGGGYRMLILSYAGNIYKAGLDEVITRINHIAEANQSHTPFYASPFLALPILTDHSIGVCFDQINREFLWFFPQYDYVNRFSAGSLFDFRTGKDLLYLSYNRRQGGQFAAVLQDTTTRERFLARFTLYDQLYYQQMMGEAANQTDHFAIHPADGNLYYSSAGKLYRHNESLGTGEIIRDFGSKHISLLKFNPFFLLNYTITGTTISHQRYADYANQLVVGVYDPLAPDHSGEFLLFDVSAKVPELVFAHGGLPQILDVTYKER